MTTFQRFLKFFSLMIIILSASLAGAFGPAGEGSGANSPELGSDLAVELKIPLFDPEFAETPVARLDAEPVLLGELTPALEPKSKILFWEYETGTEKLRKQFNTALAERIKQQGSETNQMTTFTSGEIDEDQRLKLSAPLFSEFFAEVPVAIVNGTPITISEFAADLQSVHSDVSSDHAHSTAEDNIQELIDRLIIVRLIEQEARNIGFDKTPSLLKQAENFAEKTLLFKLLNTHISGLSVDDKAVEKLYHQISLEAQLESYLFTQKEDAVAVLEAYKNEENFEALIDTAIEEGKTVAGQDKGYIKLNDLIPNIAKAVNQMEIGALSEIFTQADGFLLFQLIDRRFVEDPKAQRFALNRIWGKQTAKASAEYIQSLVDRYATFSEEAREALDFKKIKESNPSILLSEALAPLLEDERPLATISSDETYEITVSEVADRVKGAYFHGTDIPLKPAEVNLKKEEIIKDKLFRLAGVIEAQKMGLDDSTEYRNEIAEFERKILFNSFLQKIIEPEIRLTEEEIKDYYNKHQTDYLTPAMVKFESLPFYSLEDAQGAAEKLRKGSDFKWVSANVEGLVNVEDKNLLQFDRNILSITSLPEKLRGQVENATSGDVLIHVDADNFYYVLYLEDVYKPEPEPYDQVRKEIMKKIYQQHVKNELSQWAEKLKEAYETKIFLVRKSG